MISQNLFVRKQYSTCPKNVVLLSEKYSPVLRNLKIRLSEITDYLDCRFCLRGEIDIQYHSSIAVERNKNAVEIVVTIVTLIEQCGNHEPRIKASTIIAKNPLLCNSLEEIKSTSNKNRMLRQTFSKAFDLLKTKTDLCTTYKNIHLPSAHNPADIPTTATYVSVVNVLVSAAVCYPFAVLDFLSYLS